MSLIRKHGAVLQAWACLDLVNVMRCINSRFIFTYLPSSWQGSIFVIRDEVYTVFQKVIHQLISIT